MKRYKGVERDGRLVVGAALKGEGKLLTVFIDLLTNLLERFLCAPINIHMNS